jgi:UDP-3-O-[3-hydroxymyristoyl] N-acetylglucosamine deacetylase
VGDHLLGHPLIGAYTAYKSGYALNNQLLRETLARPEAWEFVTFEREAQVPQAFVHWRTHPV